MVDALDQRRAERENLLSVAWSYAADLSRRLDLIAAVVVGSVARGDFNVWSDVDVVVVAEGLPAREPDRTAVLSATAPARVQPVGFTPDEFRTAWKKGNPLAREATEGGVILGGHEFFQAASEA